MKIALVHDYLTQYGGAERTLESLAKIWENAPIYTSIFHKRKIESQGFSLKNNEVKTSFMQKFPNTKKWANTYYLPIYPAAFENFIFDDFDIVFSVNSYASKAVITKPETIHISYCCTPPRHLWSYHDYVKHHNHVKFRHKIVLKPLISYLRLWDQVASSRVDHYVAISKAIRDRIEQVYRRESIIIYPPVMVKKYMKEVPPPIEKNYFLIVSRLGGHKRVDLAIKVFNKLKNKQLVIIGDGPMKAKYQEMAGDNIIFKGRLTDEATIGYYQNCLAFLYPQEEDFGITAIEAQAAGKPVIGYGNGGLLDTVINGETGLYFEKQTVKDMANVIKEFVPNGFSSQKCIKNAKNSSEEIFQEKIEKLVEKKWEEYITKTK